MITIAKTEPPPVLYKYYPPERLDVVLGLEVYFSSPSKFNDAFDTYHLLPLTSDPKVRMARSKLRNEMGILCLTERPDNHMMWVSYARNHTGFVLGFDTASPFFEEEGRELRKVIYQSRPPVFPDADENGCFYKSPEWRYEEEWRCIRRFAKDERRAISFEWPIVKQIIFGHQIAPWMISRIIQYATLWSNDETPIPLVFSSTPSHSEWKFVNKQQNFTMCDKCSGEGYLNPKPEKAE